MFSHLRDKTYATGPRLGKKRRLGQLGEQAHCTEITEKIGLRTLPR